MCRCPRLSDLKEVITNEMNGLGGEASQDAASWKQIFDRLCASELKCPPDAVKLVKSLKVHWSSVATRILNQHVSEEIGPYLGLLKSDIVNNVQLHDVPNSWTANCLRDAVSQAQSRDQKIHVAFQPHDFLSELIAWHQKVLKKEQVDTALEFSLMNMWNDLSRELQSVIQEEGTVNSVNEFGAAVQEKLMGDLGAQAKELQSKVREQMIAASEVETFEEATFTKSDVEAMQRLGAVLKKQDEALATRLLSAGEAGEHFLALCAASVLYSNNKTKIAISSRPDKLTVSTLKALHCVQATALGFFRKHKTFDIATLLLGESDNDAVVNFAKVLGDLVSFNDVWEQELTDMMASTLAPLTKQVKDSVASLPGFELAWAEGEGMEEFQKFQNGLKERKVADNSAMLMKKCEACLHCCKLGMLPSCFTMVPWHGVK